jgi:hypothetical protein
MRSRQDRKNEWIKYSGLNYSKEDRWLRDKIAALFDIEEPNEDQRHVLHMADLRLTLFDLPGGAYPNHKEELMALAQKLLVRRRCFALIGGRCLRSGKIRFLERCAHHGCDLGAE